MALSHERVWRGGETPCQMVKGSLREHISAHYGCTTQDLGYSRAKQENTGGGRPFDKRSPPSSSNQTMTGRLHETPENLIPADTGLASNAVRSSAPASPAVAVMLAV